MNLNDLIKTEKLGYKHSFGDTFVLTGKMVKDCGRSKIEGKYFVKVKINKEEEIVDYLTPVDCLALQNGKRIECTWTRSRSGKAYWNHSSKYLDEVVEA